jgi:hypothetical protein
LVAPLLANLNVTTADGRHMSPQRIATETSMRIVRDAILGGPDRPGYVADMGGLPSASTGDYPRMYFLFVDPTGCGFDPNARCGWQGPYLISNGQFVEDASAGFTSPYGNPGDLAVLDAWGRPLVFQFDPMANTWNIVSAGPDRSLSTIADNIYLALY